MIFKNITLAKPNFDLSSLFFRRNQKLVSPWSKLFFYNSGRDAILDGLNFLGLKKGARILLPSYICSSVSNSLKQAGFELIFVDVGNDLLMPIDELLEIIRSKKIKGVLLVDYFGFLAEENIKIADKLSEIDVLVLIDRCHSAISLNRNKNYWNTADAIILSIRKTILVPDGGALILNSKKNIVDSTLKSIWYKNLLFLLYRLLDWIIYIVGWPNIYSYKVAKIRSLINRNNNSTSTLKFPYDFSNAELRNINPSNILFNQLCNIKRLSEVAKLRRDNYNKLSKIFISKGFTTLFDSLDVDVVPQVLPIIVHQSGMVDFLRNHGVGAYNWPGKELPEEVLSLSKIHINSINFNKKVVCLPIHQSINSKDIARIEFILNQWKQV